MSRCSRAAEQQAQHSLQTENNAEADYKTRDWVSLLVGEAASIAGKWEVRTNPTTSLLET